MSIFDLYQWSDPNGYVTKLRILQLQSCSNFKWLKLIWFRNSRRLTSLNSASGLTSRITKLFSFWRRSASLTSTLLTWQTKQSNELPCFLNCCNVLFSHMPSFVSYVYVCSLSFSFYLVYNKMKKFIEL